MFKNDEIFLSVRFCIYEYNFTLLSTNTTYEYKYDDERNEKAALGIVTPNPLGHFSVRRNYTRSSSRWEINTARTVPTKESAAVIISVSEWRVTTAGAERDKKRSEPKTRARNRYTMLRRRSRKHYCGE